MPATRIGREFLDQKGIAKSHIMHRQVQAMEYVSFYWTGGTDNASNNPTETPVPDTTDISYRNSRLLL